MKVAILGLAALVLLNDGVGQAEAGMVYYNGPIKGTDNAWIISQGQQVTDSFTLTGPTSLTGAQVGLWLLPGDAAIGVDWAIGTSAFASDVGSGTASLSNVFQYSNSFTYSVFDSTFSLDATLGAGTYWLTLHDGMSRLGNYVFWDENDGPSSSLDSPLGAIGSESFQVYGAAVPEPASLILFGLGVVGLLGCCGRRSPNLPIPFGATALTSPRRG